MDGLRGKDSVMVPPSARQSIHSIDEREYRRVFATNRQETSWKLERSASFAKRPIAEDTNKVTDLPC